MHIWYGFAPDSAETICLQILAGAVAGEPVVVTGVALAGEVNNIAMVPVTLNIANSLAVRVGRSAPKNALLPGGLQMLAADC
jgi:hypothetical protein